MLPDAVFDRRLLRADAAILSHFGRVFEFDEHDERMRTADDFTINIAGNFRPYSPRSPIGSATISDSSETRILVTPSNKALLCGAMVFANEVDVVVASFARSVPRTVG